MGRVTPAVLVLVLAFLSPVFALQRTRRATSATNATAATGAYKEPAATMRGTLKRITSKAVILLADGDQSVEIVRTHKTKFFRDGKEIKPSGIPIGSVLSVDVGKFPDLTPQAINVMVDAPPVDGVSTEGKPAESGSQTDRERPAEESVDPQAAPGTAPKPSPAKPETPPSR